MGLPCRFGIDNPEICKYNLEDIKLQINKNHRVATKLALIILTLSLILSSFTSCNLFSYVAGSKAEISSNVENSTEKGNFLYVSDYLRDWGVPLFNTLKFKYMESFTQTLYNYGDGLPKCYDHAKATASLFVEKYYDKIDINDQAAVTDALLTCYSYVIEDPYTIYRPTAETESFTATMSGKFGGIGVLVEYNHTDESIIVQTVYPGSPAEAGGVLPGDIFHAVDGKTIDEMGYQNAIDYVRGYIGSTVEITFIRNGQYVTITMERAEIDELNVVYEIDENKIGYVQIVQFVGNTYSQFVEAIDYLEEQGVKGIIFDLRGNPGGYVSSVSGIISYLIPNGNTVVSYQYKGQPTKYYITGNDDNNGDHVVDLPFVVICDEKTASSGEIFTSALRDYDEMKLINATIVGTTTYGKGIMQNTYYYIDQSSITMTVAYYNPPLGVNYHGIGVIPDVVVENTDSNVDLQLEAAYSEMEKLLNTN